jgi:hypothetical protein
VPDLPSTRREWLARAAGGFGSLALAGLLAEAGRADAPRPEDPLAPRPGQFAGKAKSVIFLFSTGGVSHVDTFDHKPRLIADHGKTITVENPGNAAGKLTQYLKKPHFAFHPCGKSGTHISELFPHLGAVIDDVCLLNGVVGDSPGHDKATLGLHTGSVTFARPGIGAWVSYGLGTPNRNLPSFVVIAPAAPYAGAANWGSDFLPGCHQGTLVTPGPTPLPNLTPRTPTAELQQMELELLGQVNREHQQTRPADRALEARIRSFETAFGMQREAPETFDLSKETDATLDLYGLKRGATAGFGWQCLVARRLVERGVRFVELIDVGSNNNWDSHGDMEAHRPLAKAVDRPIAALLTDLKRRGLLESTLVVWTTEFGRTPFNGAANAAGREHHHTAFSSWLAGGGVKGGIVYGESDEYGIRAGDRRVHVHDLHATILHCLGLDHEKLTFRHAGRDYRLTDVAGEVLRPVLA